MVNFPLCKLISPKIVPFLIIFGSLNWLSKLQWVDDTSTWLPNVTENLIFDFIVFSYHALAAKLYYLG